MEKLKQRALRAIGLEDAAFSGELRIAARSNRFVSLAGVTAVRRYTPDCLRLQAADGIVQIDGFELMLRTICTGMVQVCGRIDAIRFEIPPAEAKG